MKFAIATILGLALCVSVAAQQTLQHSKKFGKDHSADYQVGVLQSTEQVNTGTFTSCDHGCMSNSTGHNVHYVVTADGVYTIQAPTSFGKSLLQGMLVSPNLPDVHVQWFMDDMHPGDKVLFAVNCGKHNDCYFWLPKPDQPGKEYMTNGWFRPRVAQTNTQQLCGTGKLSTVVEAQVCKPVDTPNPPQAELTSTPAVAPTPVPTDSSTDVKAPSVERYPPTVQSQTDPRIEQFRKMCNSSMFKSGRDDFAIQQCGIVFPPK